MKKISALICLLVIVSCQNSKYNPQSYMPESSSDIDSDIARLRNDCLSFMNYCDSNYSSDLTLFVRDYLRTWKEWTTDGVNDYSHVVSCQIKRKERRIYDVRSIHFAIWLNKDPHVFEAEYHFFNDGVISHLLDMARQEFGEPDHEIETDKGMIYEWFVSDTKTVSVEMEKGKGTFMIEYQLTQ
ncbi:MAG: hypothetical protein K5778_10170 [Bacteroidaceae bacterium]|nr:hypothetical protein [Bacteroidaceae bacterium]